MLCGLNFIWGQNLSAVYGPNLIWGQNLSAARRIVILQKKALREFYYKRKNLKGKIIFSEVNNTNKVKVFYDFFFFLNLWHKSGV